MCLTHHLQRVRNFFGVYEEEINVIGSSWTLANMRLSKISEFNLSMLYALFKVGKIVNLMLYLKLDLL